MKKLSELSMETMLCVEHQNDGDFDVMSKEDYLNSGQFLDYPVEPFTAVCLACKQVKRFDLWDYIEYTGEDDTYDGWDFDVYNDVKDTDVTLEFINQMNDAFNRNPTYWEGEKVEVDMVPSSPQEPIEKEEN